MTTSKQEDEYVAEMDSLKARTAGLESRLAVLSEAAAANETPTRVKSKQEEADEVRAEATADAQQASAQDAAYAAWEQARADTSRAHVLAVQALLAADAALATWVRMQAKQAQLEADAAQRLAKQAQLEADAKLAVAVRVAKAVHVRQEADAAHMLAAETWKKRVDASAARKPAAEEKIK